MGIDDKKSLFSKLKSRKCYILEKLAPKKYKKKK